MITRIAGQIAIAVENAINFEQARQAEKEIRRQFERERLMMEINNAVVSNLNLPELLAAIAAFLRHVMPHDFAGLALYDPDCDRLRVQALDYTRNLEIFGTPRPDEKIPKSACLVPLISHGRKLGILGVGAIERTASRKTTSNGSHRLPGRLLSRSRMR